MRASSERLNSFPIEKWEQKFVTISQITRLMNTVLRLIKSRSCLPSLALVLKRCSSVRVNVSKCK